MHFSWFHFIKTLEGNPDHVLTGALCTLFICAFSLIAYSMVRNVDAAVAPKGLSLRSFFEVIVEFLSDLGHSVIGHGGEAYVPIAGSLFIFILFNNLLGLLPGFNPATDNLNTTLACGLFVFVLYNAAGIKEHGVAYLKHFLGPILLLAPFMLPLELISHLVRPASLGLRLFGNMTGDHQVLSAFLNLAPYGIPMIFYALGIFVCVVQAYVFTLLSMVYISIATAHDH